MKPDTHDITIAGAGPAGLTAAILLARAGYRTRVFEARSTVGGRFNDDYQGLENWSRTEDVLIELQTAGIQASWWNRPYCGGVLYDPELRPIQIQSPKPLFYMVRRGRYHPGSLDLALLEQARQEGVEVLFNRRLDSKEATIMATGPQGSPDLIAAGITFKIERDDFAAAILNDTLAPAGYVYFLICEGQATLATVLFEKYGEAHGCLQRAMDTVQRLFEVRDFPDIKHWGGYGAFSVPYSCEQQGALLVGEAAGFQDFLFGFGIRNALISGRLAAKSIIEGRSYDALWRERLLPYLKASAVNRAIYSKLGNTAKKAFWRLTGKSNRPDGFMHWLYNFSVVHRLLYPFVSPKFGDTAAGASNGRFAPASRRR
jgi:flavin-dependent dehydrogenase